MIRLPKDFKEFLKLLNDNDVDYLVVGAYAVGVHGYPITRDPAQSHPLLPQARQRVLLSQAGIAGMP